MMRKQVLSCIQPTGEMHLGNYFGAVKNWVELQDEYDCLYGVVDYHAITIPQNYQKVRTNTWDLITNLVSVGIKPENIFIQSLVPEHAELAWIFNCFCSSGQLSRMTQFKDKSRSVLESSNDQFISAGLLNYPILQAADILIYKADFVPVGKDQEQHLELTRNIAQRFNQSVGKEYFVLPETLFTETPKIRSTADPDRKMSKSAGDKHYISVFTDEAKLRKQIRSAVTDSGDITSSGMSAGVANLFELLKASGEDKNIIDSFLGDFEAGQLKYADLKQQVADSLIRMLAPFKEKKAELLSDKKELKKQIKASSAEIRKIARVTINEVKDLVGLMKIPG